MKDIIRMNQLAGIITEGQAKKMMDILNEDLEKNLIQKISKTLKSNNPDVDIKKIIDVVTSWLSQGKNLMTANNAMGDDFKKDVLNPIESSLTEAKSEDSHPDYNLNSGKKLHPVVKSLTFDSEEELQNYLKNKSKSSKSMGEAKSEDKVVNEANSLKKNLIKNITKYLKKRNPTFPEDIIIKKVSSWLNQGKNLMTATNAMGDDFKKDVLDVLQNKLT